jgi:hypothetical protein
LVVPKLFVSFSFFSSSPAFFFNRSCFYRQKEWKVWFELCFETASLKERQLLITHIKLWPKERNRREKPRNRYDQTERFSRVKMRRALTFCCPSFLRAFKRVYIYIWCINLDSPNSKGFPSPNSLIPEGINL